MLRLQNAIADYVSAGGKPTVQLNERCVRHQSVALMLVEGSDWNAILADAPATAIIEQMKEAMNPGDAAVPVTFESLPSEDHRTRVRHEILYDFVTTVCWEKDDPHTWESLQKICRHRRLWPQNEATLVTIEGCLEPLSVATKNLRMCRKSKGR